MHASGIDLADLAKTLLRIQKIARAKRSSVPFSKRSSISLKGFRLQLPNQRSRAGTDENLVRQPYAGNRDQPQGRSSLSELDEAAVWEDMALVEYTEGLLDDSSSTRFGRSRGDLGGVAFKYHCPIPSAGGIGHADFHSLVRTLAQDSADNLGTDLLLLSIACLTPIDEVAHLQLGEDGETIRRFPAPGWEQARSDSLHLPSNPWIEFRPPPIVLSALSRILKAAPSGNDFLVQEAKARLAPFPTVTLARLREYILYNGPDEWGYSPAAAMLAWKGIGPRPGVFASYLRGDKIFRTFGDLYRLFDLGWKSEGVTNAFGCRHVPRAESVVALRSLTTFQNWSVPQRLAECRLKWNASVAGLNLLGCVLTGGTRNFIGAPPPGAARSDAFIVNLEKLHSIPTVFSTYLREGLRHLEIAQQEVRRRFGIFPPRPPGAAFGFWMENDEAGEVSPISTRRALEEYSPTNHLGALHPNAMRALAMTILYEDGRIHTHDIERFFGRAFAAMTPMCSHRLEPALEASLIRTIEQTILRHLDL